jgi:hypothetical protein
MDICWDGRITACGTPNWQPAEGAGIPRQARSLCGSVTCREYVELKDVIEGTQVY